MEKGVAVTRHIWRLTVFQDRPRLVACHSGLRRAAIASSKSSRIQSCVCHQRRNERKSLRLQSSAERPTEKWRSGKAEAPGDVNRAGDADTPAAQDVEIVDLGGA